MREAAPRTFGRFWSRAAGIRGILVRAPLVSVSIREHEVFLKEEEERCVLLTVRVVPEKAAFPRREAKDRCDIRQRLILQRFTNKERKRQEKKIKI